MSDKPEVDLVISDLEKEIEKPKPLTAVLPGTSIRVTFQDPFDFKMSERHKVLEEYQAVRQGNGDDYDFLRKIMSKEDFKKYEKADLDVRLHNAVMAKVMAHFEGTLGESNA